ncbi:hypothetical protein HOY80DRAFT_1139455 [Tuber brumale]|nr:hypothetical protein HOY80DRAFT_1139455 [Tuber brumale]
MSNESVDCWFDSIFSTLNGHENLSFPDSDTGIEKIDNESCNSVTPNEGSYYNLMSDQNCPEVTLSPLCPDSQRQNVKETKQQTAPERVAKKRKPWGRELPIPTTHLPPRKRARTAEEKEQRRIERILRNRAAAQTSRERKEKEVQGLGEERTRLALDNGDLNARLAFAEHANKELRRDVETVQQKLKLYEEYMGVVPSGIAPTAIVEVVDTSRPSPYIELPEQVLPEQEDLFLCLDRAEAPPVTTINPSFLNWRAFPDATEAMIDVSLLSW